MDIECSEVEEGKVEENYLSSYARDMKEWFMKPEIAFFMFGHLIIIKALYGQFLSFTNSNLVLLKYG